LERGAEQHRHADAGLHVAGGVRCRQGDDVLLRQGAGDSGPEDPEAGCEVRVLTTRLVPAPFIVAYGLSGSAALMYEVVWTRLLTQQMGQAVSAVATVLAAFMGGMAAGAVIGGSLVARRSPAQAARLYGYIEFIVAACALAVPAGLASLHPLLAAAYADGEGGLSFGIVRACSVVALLGVPAAALGATFPVASRWAIVDPRRRAGAAGGLYAANTLGAAAGAALA